MVGSFSYNVQPAPDFLFQTPPAATTCSHPVAQARRLTIQTTSAPLADARRPPISPVPSSPSTSSMGGSSANSSGWNSPMPSFSFPARATTPAPSTYPDVSESSVQHAASLRAALQLSVPVTAPAATFLTVNNEPSPRRRRYGHSRDTSVTDWYAHFAADWSAEQYPVPGAWDTRDAVTAVAPAACDEEEQTPAKDEQRQQQPARKLRDDLWENDGVVSVYSQTHPAECSDAQCSHHGDLDLLAVKSGKDTTPSIGLLGNGIWHVFKSRGMSHNCLVGGLARYEAQRSAVWTKISEAMYDLDRRPLAMA